MSHYSEKSHCDSAFVPAGSLDLKPRFKNVERQNTCTGCGQQSFYLGGVARSGVLDQNENNSSTGETDSVKHK